MVEDRFRITVTGTWGHSCVVDNLILSAY